MFRRGVMLGVSLAAIGGLLATACSSNEDEPVANDVSVTAADFSFAGLDNLRPGTNNITLVNEGSQVHHLQFVKVEGDHSLEEVLGGLAEMEAGGPPPDYVTFNGGVGQIAPGTQAGTIAELEAGKYAVLCFVPDSADGVPHLAKGMASLIEIDGEGETVAEPEVDVEVSGIDYAFNGADEPLDAGRITLRLRNEGAEPHEANVLQLAEGATVASVAEWFQEPAGPPPFVNMGGAQGVMPGSTTLATLDLEAGNYALICFIPNAEGVPHAFLGMAKPFVVD